jgi:vacuolar-type H+-ATPase subunit I/STV1
VHRCCNVPADVDFAAAFISMYLQCVVRVVEVGVVVVVVEVGVVVVVVVGVVVVVVEVVVGVGVGVVVVVVVVVVVAAAAAAAACQHVTTGHPSTTATSLRCFPAKNSKLPWVRLQTRAARPGSLWCRFHVAAGHRAAQPGERRIRHRMCHSKLNFRLLSDLCRCSRRRPRLQPWCLARPRESQVTLAVAVVAMMMRSIVLT